MSIGPVSPAPFLPPVQPSATPANAPATGFVERVETAVRDLAASQDKAARSAVEWELGARQDLAAVMVDQQVASLGFQLALNVRNKALGAYRDIMNMPV